MYFAGVNFSLNHTQGVEAIVTFTVVASVVDIVRGQRKYLKYADDNGGPVSKDGTPKSLIGKLVTPVHGLATTVPPLVYVVSVLANKLMPPAWMDSYRLPDIGVGEEAWARTAACLGSFGLAALMRGVLSHLGKGLHFIAVSSPTLMVVTLLMRSTRSAKNQALSRLARINMFATHCTRM